MTKSRNSGDEACLFGIPTLSLIRYSPLQYRHFPPLFALTALAAFCCNRGREMARSLYVARCGMLLHYDRQSA